MQKRKRAGGVGEVSQMGWDMPRTYRPEGQQAHLLGKRQEHSCLNPYP